jgi:hypothetical protein
LLWWEARGRRTGADRPLLHRPYQRGPLERPVAPALCNAVPGLAPSRLAHLYRHTVCVSVLPLALARALAPDESARPVPGASRYWITDHGRLFSTVDGVREMRLTPHGRGYLQVDLWRDTDRARTRPGR